VITGELKDRPDLQKEWRVFLKTQPKCLFPDGRSTTLDFSLEEKRLDNELPTLQAKCFNSSLLSGNISFKKTPPVEISQGIRSVLHDSFSTEDLRLGGLQTSRDIGCKCKEELYVTVQDEESKAIYGVLFGAKLRLASSNRSVLYINGVSRLAKASHLGIGTMLVKKFIETVKSKAKDLDIILHVDKDNAAACALYKKCGMTISQDEDRYHIAQVQPDPNNLLFVYNQAESE